jgi:hemolysin III
MQDRTLSHEELLNTVTHGVGALASTVAGSVLVTLAALFGDLWQLLGAAVYSVSLLLLFSASTLYHAVRHQVAKARLRVVDHAAIYVLIAGTYTPFTLVALRGRWGWTLLTVVWTLAAAGIVFKLFCTGRFPRLSTATYLAMGWLAVLAAGPLLRSVPLETLLWLAAGGLAYTAGIFFFHNRRLPFAHTIWHLFVLAGSACHFVAVTMQVLAPPT